MRRDKPGGSPNAELSAHTTMNYLAHAIPFLDKPYFAAATGAPDWLMVVDRKVRVRKKHVEAFLRDADPILAAVAGGIAQHLHDDAWFHDTRAFFEVSGNIADLSRRVIESHNSPHPQPLSQKERGDASEPLRMNFLGHLLCEVLLDATLADENPRQVEQYYQILDGVDPSAIESAVNRMAPRETRQLGFFIGEFRRARILWDYLEDAKLMVRLNQVMRRVGLPLLPDDFAQILPEARRIVREKKTELFNFP
jgi:hypothetical protein